MVNAIYSTADVGRLLGVETWRVRRIYEDGMIPEPGRVAGKRAVPAQQLPAIIDALRARGWLAEQSTEAAS